MSGIRYFIIVALLLVGTLVQAEDSPRLAVVAAVEPLRSIAAEIGGDLVDSSTLFGAHADMHHAALRPSALRRLRAADLVLWVGDSRDARLAGLNPQTGLITPTSLGLPSSARRHFWLDPENGRTLARALAHYLSTARPGAAPDIQARLQAFEVQLDALQQELLQQLGPFARRGVLVAHDAYRPFLDRFAVLQTAALRDSDDTPAGARSAAQFVAAAANSACLLAGDQQELIQAQALLGQAGLAAAVLPPSSLLPTRSYSEFLRWFGAGLATCLAAGS